MTASSARPRLPGLHPGRRCLPHPVGDQILVEGLTPRGDDLVQGAGFAACAQAGALRAAAKKQRPEPFGRTLARPVGEIRRSCAPITAARTGRRT